MRGLCERFGLVCIVFIWLFWYGLAIAKEIRKNRVVESKPVQLQITDIWAAMPGMLLVFYYIFSHVTDEQTNSLAFSVDMVIQVVISCLFIGSQFAGLFLFFLQLSRFKEPRRQSRSYRALAVFLGSILNIVTCGLIILFAGSLLSGSLCTIVFGGMLLWIFRGLKEA